MARKLPRRRSASSSRKRSGALHGAAGFTLGLVAVAAGLSFNGATGGERGPVSEAARAAEVATAIRMAFDAQAQPISPSQAVPQIVTFWTDDDEPLFRPRGATRIVVPAVGIDAEVNPVGYVFRDGRLQYDVPRREAGHYVGTADPGMPGNAVIAGHVTNRGAKAVFEHLPEVKAGDLIRLYSGEQSFEYQVTGIRVVAADAVDVMAATPDATITLITCFPDENFRERLVVTGALRKPTALGS